MLETLQAKLQAALAEPCPTSILLTIPGTSLLIAYLAHLPNTRTLRLGLWPVGVLALIWVLLTTHFSPVINCPVAITSFVYALGFNSIWAFAREPPRYHPLPRPSLYSGIRQLKLVKAIELVLNAHRFVGVEQFWPPYKAHSGRHLRASALAYHLFWAVVAVLMLDLASYLPFRLAPDTFGSAAFIGGDFKAWCAELAASTGVPLLVVRAFWTASLCSTTHFALISLPHTFAIIGLGSGYFEPEEWPNGADWPVLSTSLNGFWKRWQQFITTFLKTVTRPFEWLPSPLYMMLVFAASAWFHIALFYPLKHQLIVYPYLVFYLGNGMGCLAEQGYWRMTGKRVGGVGGRIWTWTFLYLISQPMVEEQYGTGWAGAMRNNFATHPQSSMVCWLVYALGWGPHPADIHAKSN